ncbi:diaminopimelate epimerase [Clostridium liquoris]|jgi:diaminopimelate epimerase|uniref:Diaminopimelate epimerase n=2 Tax=Clostridium liquoris TaxID=1289519 RepID=A0A2T0B039_9CLOT|nr:diaminopimelate epimerase [Clostridium liquoris]PRR76874.1 diaminopimelate epimerase [Clostridium liquoris]
MTIFVLDQVPRNMQMHVAKKLMSYSNICAEQVGFIEKAIVHKELEDKCLRLQMMGGEFCGNATRALAALMVHNQYPNITKAEDGHTVQLEVSGIDSIINCQVYKTEDDNTYLSQVNMPLPKEISDFSFEVDGIVFSSIKVEFEGITHFIVDSKKVKDKDLFFKQIKNEMDKTHYDAFGIMYYDYNEEFLEPLVYVKGTDSLFWERSCASGTSALGVALTYMKKKNIDQKVRQPGGLLQVTTKWSENSVESICLNGTVEIVAEGIVNV